MLLNGILDYGSISHADRDDPYSVSSSPPDCRGHQRHLVKVDQDINLVVGPLVARCCKTESFTRLFSSELTIFAIQKRQKTIKKKFDDQDMMIENVIKSNRSGVCTYFAT